MTDLAGAADILRALSVVADGAFARLAREFAPDAAVTGPSDQWRVNVKAEIDLDDSAGEDRCVLNEQEIVDVEQAPQAIAAAADLVVSFPRAQLLTAGWEPPEW